MFSDVLVDNLSEEISQEMNSSATRIKIYASFILNSIEENRLKKEDIDKYKDLLIKHNKKLKKQIKSLLFYKAKTLTCIYSIQSNWKNEIESTYKNIGIKNKAFDYISSGIRTTFVLSTNPEGYELILYKENEKVNKDVPESRIGRSVNDFIQFMKDTDIEEVIVTGEDHKGLIKVYKTYLDHIKDLVNNKDKEDEKDFYSDDKQFICIAIESYITSELCSKLFSQSPSEKDKKFFAKMQQLRGIDPSCFKIPKESLSYEFWESAIKGFDKLELCRSPVAVVNFFAETVGLIGRAREKFETKYDPNSADNKLSSLNYLLIRAAPEMLISYFK
eukprot:TRINITY_DN5543_c0_g1_i1.p1 TRINITY_DN5543_c0_g1~~TRINITY_DN5543_c0_g1_i1.p1  ORF type:complete len:332 (-),score=80.29 TRINITY_DN5543_c0_g1_i1:313-1308(-)